MFMAVTCTYARLIQSPMSELYRDLLVRGEESRSMLIFRNAI